MTYEEVIRRLENVTPPDIKLEGHRQELRASLLREYSRAQSRYNRAGLFGFMQSWSPVWKTILFTSTAWALVALIVILSILIPRYQPQSITAKAVNAVLANQEVRAALANDEMETVTVNDIGNHRLEVMIEGRGGSIIIAHIDTRDNTLIIKEITYIIFLGSPYDIEEHLTEEEQEKAMTLVSVNITFQELLDEGATISKTIAIYCIVTTRRLDIGETTETKERWAMVQLELGGKYSSFIVDLTRGRVLIR